MQIDRYCKQRERTERIDELLFHFRKNNPDFIIMDGTLLETCEIALYIKRRTPKNGKQNKTQKIHFHPWDIDDYTGLKELVRQVEFLIENFDVFDGEEETITDEHKPLQIKNCVNCNAVLEKNTETCPYCGTCY